MHGRVVNTPFVRSSRITGLGSVSQEQPMYQSKDLNCWSVRDGHYPRACELPTHVGEHLAEVLFGQVGTFSFLEAVSGSSHKETWAGCIVSLTTPIRSSLKASRSVSSRVLQVPYLWRSVSPGQVWLEPLRPCRHARSGGFPRLDTGCKSAASPCPAQPPCP